MSSGNHLSRSAKHDLGLFARLRLRVSCMFGNHEPNRNKVRRTTGVYYAGVCRHCGVAIRKRHGHPWKASSSDEAREDQAALAQSDQTP
jgi:hypothetical protein